jgi:cytochrome b561
MFLLQRPYIANMTPVPPMRTRATSWFFFVIAVLFLFQTLVGAAAEHYRADISSFFGFDSPRLLTRDEGSQEDAAGKEGCRRPEQRQLNMPGSGKVIG